MDETLILMAVRNGELFLPDQLASIAAQRNAGWRLLVSDDGSSDGSGTLLAEFATRHGPGQVTVLQGPSRGATENFRFLVRQAGRVEGHLAFCDQDDVWHPDHLARAAQMIAEAPARDAQPILYGCRMEVCDATLRTTGLSPLPRRPTGFRNALVQNVFSGNGMVMNAAAASLLHAAETEAGPILLHDWWAYQLLSGAGAATLFDARPGLRYRQHGGNLVGANNGLAAVPGRLLRHLNGDYGTWHRRNLAALSPSSHRLTTENRQVFDLFATAFQSSLLPRLKGLRRAGVYHQSLLARVAFWTSVVLGLT